MKICTVPYFFVSKHTFASKCSCKISGFSKLRNKDCPLLRLFDVELCSTGKKARNFKMKLQKNISMPDLQ